MVKEVFENIFKIEIPLPKNPLKYINSYVIHSCELTLIVDTGLKNELCRKALSDGLKKIGKKTNRTSFFITHMHADHSGLLSEFSTDDSVVYLSKDDEPFITGSMDWDYFWEHSRYFAISHGFPLQLSKEAILRHPGYLYSSKQPPKGNIVNVKNGYVIEVGHYKFQCISTPGHTKGHVCLYEKDKGILFSGDHVLYDITPNISAGYENKNPLGMYLKSLENIKSLEVNIVLPGHRNIFTKLRERIKEIEKHHKNRLNEILNILENADKNAYEVASLMSWDIDCENFEDYPTAQKWFAHSEAVAHLLYLYDVGKVTYHKTNGVYIFSLA